MFVISILLDINNLLNHYEKNVLICIRKFHFYLFIKETVFYDPHIKIRNIFINPQYLVILP